MNKNIKLQELQAKEYDKITAEEIEKAVTEIFTKQVKSESRNTKLWITFSSKEAAEKWFRETWCKALQEAANKHLQDGK